MQHFDGGGCKAWRGVAIRRQPVSAMVTSAYYEASAMMLGLVAGGIYSTPPTFSTGEKRAAEDMLVLSR